ncbi:MAG: metallophosphoesterase [Actinobacteria bacterium]|nr:metallophosphoesterase [Actinomycetota bacterium]
MFFATDIHGSEVCFRKWLAARKAYGADVLVLGGDMTGKALIPIVEAGPDRWTAVIRGEERVAAGQEQLAALREAVGRMGYYALVISPDEKAELDADPVLLEKTFRRVMRESLEHWMQLADERLPEGFPAFAMLGNDDYPELAEVLSAGRAIQYGEEAIGELPGEIEIVSVGFSNPTPWDSPRELSEEDLEARIGAAAEKLRSPERAIFNLHCPPFDTNLDLAPALDSSLKPRAGMAGGVELAPVGSTAVRGAIERYQPMLGLHGHVHECSAGDKLGRTLCVNPGSNYMMGALKGALIEVGRSGEVRGWQMTEG